MAKALTREQVIKAWNADHRYHEWFVCPDCRDVLFADNNKTMSCPNTQCLNEKDYNLITGEEV
jgi:hypothetical protein